MWMNIGLVSLGAALGACLRWGFGNWFEQVLPWPAAGTLFANWLGAFLIGVFVALDEYLPGMTPPMRLLVVTGFLGGLTTFSGFSLEMVSMLHMQRYVPVLASVALHVFGSLVLTAAGMFCVQLWRG